MANPRNNTAVKQEVTDNRKPASEWKTLSLGSLSVKGSNGNLIREGMVNFTINSRNAQVILDAANYILSNPEDKVTISAGTFFEDSNVSDKVKKFFSHRLYISAETLEKFGKNPGDYVDQD